MANTKPTSAASARIDEHVDGIVSSIGPKLKRLRQEQRLSLQQLAGKAEVSAAAIHKIERNDMVPTITTLLKIATALDRPVTYFVEQDDGQPEPVAFTPSKHRPDVFTPHAGLTLEGVSGPYAPFRSAAAVATVDPGADSGDKPLVHAGEELVFTLAGTLVFDIAGAHYEVGRGDSLHFMGDQPHHWANEGKAPARVIWVALRDS
ncbi:MAG TPA: XRE family transcriptional regulator [Nocardioidaceae bacterium]|nr:XRE family transcriptional regulator [Nocardioidaceae bacterium]